MAQVSRKDDASSYYPPRSRWHTRILYNAGRPVRRHFNLRRIIPASKVSPAHLLLTVALPGFAFLLLGRRLLGWVVVAVYLASAILFIAALGFPAASVGYGLLISLHAISIMFVEWLWLKDSRLGAKVVVACLTLFAVWGLMYAPLVEFAESHWFIPLREGNRVFIVQRRVAAGSIKRGDWLAYEIPGDTYRGEREAGVYLQSGFGIDPVLALPGDRLRFTREAVYINDKPMPLAPHMPVQEEIVVPEKVWFIWPSLDIYRHGGGTEASISATMQRTAMVAQKQIIGRPFKHWFGRRQWP